MKRRSLIIVLILMLALGTWSSFARSEEIDPVEGESEPTLEDLEVEFKKTLDAIKRHFEKVQENLEQAGMDREPAVDQAIKELEKEQQSMLETLEGLGTILLEAHSPKEPYEEQSTTTFEDVEDDFWKVINDLEAYIEEREKYWEAREADPDTMLEEELARLQQDQKSLEEIVAPLTVALEEAWKDVIGGWGDVLDEWQKFVEDLVPVEE